jgi:hypothetical protein
VLMTLAGDAQDYRQRNRGMPKSPERIEHDKKVKEFEDKWNTKVTFIESNNEFSKTLYKRRQEAGRK